MAEITPEDINQAVANLAAPSWKDGFHAALAGFVANRIGKDPEDITVTSFDDEATDQGGCPTCWGGLDYMVTIWFTLPGGNYASYYEYNGHFHELLNEILEV